MSVCLKNLPNAVENWLNAKHPEIAKYVSYSEEDLNPYEKQVIVKLRKTEDRIYIEGWKEFGNEQVYGMETLEFYKLKGISDADEIEMDETVTKVNLQLLKDHIDGTFFSFETFEILCKFSNKIKSDGLIRHLHRFRDLLEVIEPTNEDLRVYFKNYPDRVKPKVWFNVKMEDIIGDFTLYSGGYFHVASTEMENWIKRQIKPKVSEFDEDIVEYLKSKEPPKRIKHIDLNNLSERIPLCLRFNDHFPTDEERQQFVRVMSNANVPLEFVKEKLEDLNNRFPHNPPLPLKRRFDYEAHYKKNYKPHGCHKMKTCPFNPDHSLNVKKSSCIALFRNNFGEGNSNYKTFKGPLDWLLW